MLAELKDVFKTKKGVLIILSMLTLAISAYLNLITIKNVMIGSFAISFGTIFISFLPMMVGDILTECFGWKKGFIISSIAYTICLIFTLIMWGSTIIPGQVFPGEGDFTFFATDAYNTLFAGSWILILASAIAYYIGIFFNCYIMGKLKDRAQVTGDNNWKLFGRFISSTVIGQTLDNAIFFLIPMAFSMWNFTYVWQQVTAAVVIEVVYEIILFTLTASIVKKITKIPEGLQIVVNEDHEVTDVIS